MTNPSNWAISLLIERAKQAGLHVVERKGGVVTITRNGRGAASIIIYPDNSILRNDVRLDLATKLTAQAAAQVLGIIK